MSRACSNVTGFLAVVSVALLAACGAKHSVTRVPASSVGSELGVYYALPKTFIDVVVPVTRTTITPTELAPYANGKIGGLVPGPDIGSVGPSTTFKFGTPSREVFTAADENALFYVDPRRGNPFVAKELVMELSDRGYLVSAQSKVDDKGLEYAVKTIETVAKVAGTLVAGGGSVDDRDSERARLAAELRDQLGKLRESRQKLVTSPNALITAEALDRMLTEIAAIDSGFLAFFRKVQTTTWDARFRIELDTQGDLGDVVLFELSPTVGVTLDTSRAPEFPMPPGFSASARFEDLSGETVPNPVSEKVLNPVSLKSAIESAYANAFFGLGQIYRDSQTVPTGLVDESGPAPEPIDAFDDVDSDFNVEEGPEIASDSREVPAPTDDGEVHRGRRRPPVVSAPVDGLDRFDHRLVEANPLDEAKYETGYAELLRKIIEDSVVAGIDIGLAKKLAIRPMPSKADRTVQILKAQADAYRAAYGELDRHMRGGGLPDLPKIVLRSSGDVAAEQKAWREHVAELAKAYTMSFARISNSYEAARVSSGLMGSIRAAVGVQSSAKAVFKTSTVTPWVRTSALGSPEPGGEDSGFVYRMPVRVHAKLALGNSHHSLDPVQVSQLGPLVELPKKLGNNSTYAITLHSGSGAIKTLTATANPPAVDAVSGVGNAVGGFLEAQAKAEAAESAAKQPSAILKSEVELLELQLKQRQLQQQLLDLEAGSTGGP